MNFGVLAPSEYLKRKRLLQDYEQLEKETDFMRKKLEMMKRKRLILMAEVRFLRKKHKYLSHHQVLVSGNSTNVGKKKQTRSGSGRTAVSRLDLNKKSNVICNERKSEAEQIDIGDGKTSGRFPVFDLNKISSEEEELHMKSEQMAMEDSNNSLQKTGNDEQQNDDLKLLGCKNIENGSGKRKVSWQDQVVLRV